MALFNHATKEVTAKLVYYGPGLCGKTTNLQWIHGNLTFAAKGKLVSLATQTDRTLFFDFLPVDLGTIRGMRVRVQIYTVPGQVFYESTRRMVLKGCDAVVFVADSQAALLDANAESLLSLRRNLLVNEIDPTVPQVIQYNKRDLPSALPVSVLNARLNPRNLPGFEAVAVEGRGVEETLKGITRLLFQWLARCYGEDDAVAAAAADGGVPAAPPDDGRRTEIAPPPVFKEPEKPRAPSDPPPRAEGLRADQWLYLLDGAQRGPIDSGGPRRSRPHLDPRGHEGVAPRPRGLGARQPAAGDRGRDPPSAADPRGPAGRATPTRTCPTSTPCRPMLRTVLIADEDAAFRKYLAMPLAAQGFTIYEAADGSAAWQLAVQNRPWMILADISMPEVDGFEFCRRVRSHPLLARMPLLFISGSDKYKERYRALQIGADDFLSKNLPIRELLMRIQLLMTRYSDLSASGEEKAGTTEVAGAFQGRVEVFGAPALLQMCAQGRLTGLFTALAEDAANTATVIGFREGDIISATVGRDERHRGRVRVPRRGRRAASSSPRATPATGEPLAQSVEHLLLEGCRLARRVPRERARRRPGFRVRDDPSDRAAQQPPLSEQESDTQVAVQGLAVPEQSHGVPSGWPRQLETHVAAASAGVGTTIDATTGSRRAAPRPTRRTDRPSATVPPATGASSRRPASASWPRASVTSDVPATGSALGSEDAGEIGDRPGPVGVAEDRGGGAVEAVRPVALPVVDQHFVRQLTDQQPVPARHRLHRVPLSPVRRRETGSVPSSSRSSSGTSAPASPRSPFSDRRSRDGALERRERRLGPEPRRHRVREHLEHRLSPTEPLGPPRGARPVLREHHEAHRERPRPDRAAELLRPARPGVDGRSRPRRGSTGASRRGARGRGRRGPRTRPTGRGARPHELGHERRLAAAAASGDEDGAAAPAHDPRVHERPCGRWRRRLWRISDSSTAMACDRSAVRARRRRPT